MGYRLYAMRRNNHTTNRRRQSILSQREGVLGVSIAHHALEQMHLGRTLKEIAAELGVHARTLTRHLRKAGWRVHTTQIVDQKLIRTRRPRSGRSGVEGRPADPPRAAALSPRPDRRRR